MKFHREVAVTESTPVPATVYDLANALVGMTNTDYDENGNSFQKTKLSKLEIVRVVHNVWKDSTKSFTSLVTTKNFVETLATEKNVRF